MSFKKVLVSGIIFLAGAVIGGAGVYIWRTKTEEQRINAEIDSVKKAFEKAHSSSNTSDSNGDDQDIGTPLKTPENGLKTQNTGIVNDAEVEKAKSENKSIIGRQKYDGYFENQDARDNMDPRTLLLEDIIESSSYPRDDDNKPYVMTESEYETDPAASDTTFLTVYEEDKILADDVTNEAVNVDESIGMDIFEKFLNAKEADDIYVKDPRTDTVYEVTKESGSYKTMMECYHGGM